MQEVTAFHRVPLHHRCSKRVHDILVNAVIAFLGGAVYEAGCVFWVHYSESGRPYATALVSMLCATAQVAGIGESVRDLRIAPFFIIGYGVGTFFAVKLKDRGRVARSE